MTSLYQPAIDPDGIVALDVHAHVEQLAGYYRARNMAAVIFTVDATTALGRPGLSTGSASAARQMIGFSGIYLLKGGTFLGFQDLLLGHAAPGAPAMEAEAQKALARVPLRSLVRP